MGWLSDVLGSKKDLLATGDVKSPEFAVHVLKQLVDRHAPAIINFRGVADQFVSMLLAVDDKKHTATLDQISPEEGHKKALAGAEFKVTLSDHGIAVIFHATVKSTGMDNNIPFYVIDVPASIEYCQRREAFRVKLHLIKPIKVNFSIDKKVIEDASIFDISFSGIQIQIPKMNLEEKLARGNTLDPIQFMLNEETISCKLELKRIRYDAETDKTFIAGRFLELDRYYARILNQAVCDLEREERKREIRDVKED